MKVVPETGDYYRVSSPPKVVSNYIKRSMKTEEKFYEQGWCIHRTHVVAICCLAYTKGAHVDYSELSLDLQMEIASKKTEFRRGKSTSRPTLPTSSKIDECYAALYLIPDAPMDIVNAAWKALAKKHHPDVGGDEETFKRLSDAYSKIKSSNG